MKIREREEPVLAVFDMEGTIISSNVVESYVWARMADLEPDEWPGELVGVFGRIPRYLAIDRRDRGDFLRTFFRRYEGASVEGLERLVDRHVGEFMLQKASPVRSAGSGSTEPPGTGRSCSPPPRTRSSGPCSRCSMW